MIETALHRHATPALIAHRGFAARHPENTLAAIRGAVDAGFRLVEFDVQLSADAVPVVVHDANLRRTAGFDLSVRETRAEDLRRVPVGEPERFGGRFATECVPLLADVVQLLAGLPQVTAFVEVKRESAEEVGVDATVERVVEALAPILDRCVVISFVERAVLHARRIGAPAVGWCLNHYDDDARIVATAIEPDVLLCDHRRLPDDGAAPWPGRWRWAVWEVVDPERARALVGRGVDYVETMDCAAMAGALDALPRAGRGPRPARVNAAVAAVEPPPIADVHRWVADRRFPDAQPLLDVAQAVPSYPPPAALSEHVGRVAARPETALYSPILGLPRLREALARHLSEDYGAALDASDVAITAGCNQAFCVAASALAGPGDEVVLPLPYYFNHRMWLDMQGIVARHVPFRPDREGVPDLDAVADAIGPRTRALALVSPNNPTGAEYPPEYLDAALDLAVERGIALILDETYKDFRAGGGPPHALFRRADWRDHLVQLYSFSKAYAMTGYRVGSIVCGEALRREIEKILDCVSICASRIGQEAAVYALEHLGAWRDEKSAQMLARVAALRRAFGDNRLVYRLVSAGAYFAYVEHPFEAEASATVARRLATAHGVLCVPGATFGAQQDRYLRFAFANLEADRLETLVERLVASQDAA